MGPGDEFVLGSAVSGLRQMETPSDGDGEDADRDVMKELLDAPVGGR